MNSVDEILVVSIDADNSVPITQRKIVFTVDIPGIPLPCVGRMYLDDDLEPVCQLQSGNPQFSAFMEDGNNRMLVFKRLLKHIVAQKTACQPH